MLTGIVEIFLNYFKGDENIFSYKNIQELNDTELFIYKYVMGNQDKVQYMTIRELASKTHVSTSSILRFCTKLGCEGYSNFKKELKDYIEKSTIIPPRPDLREILAYFQRANTGVFEEELEKGSKLLRDAKEILFYGLGSSGIIGKYGAKYFSNIGKISWSIDELSFPILNEISNNTVLFVLSVSGESFIVIEQIIKFKKHNCKILSITNTSNCTISKMSDWNINYNISKQSVSNLHDITSQIPVVFLLESLARRI